MRDYYKLRSDLRELPEASDDFDNDDRLLPKEMLREIEEALFEIDRLNQKLHNYKEVLRDVLK